jgi:preprotein translocase subunit YajC
MYPVLFIAFFIFSYKIKEHKQFGIPISMYKHLSCAAVKIKLTTGSGIAGTCGKLDESSRIRIRQKVGVLS